MENHNNSSSNKKQRIVDPYREAYDGFSYEPVESIDDRPGSPHRFFSASYRVTYNKNNGVATNNNNMRVHKHVNGLCVVTMDDKSLEHNINDTNDDKLVINFHVKETPDMSIGKKRKRATSMVKGKLKEGTELGVVKPSDTLITIEILNDKSNNNNEKKKVLLSTYPCCVFGSIIELNHNITIELIQNNPLLKGYLAIILPSGPFPPPTK